MGTMAIVGMGTVETGWVGTLVGYDGYPSGLGPKLLDVVREHGGDLDATWAFIARAPNGWRHAFDEPYEDDHEHHGVERPAGLPLLLRHTDAFVTGDYSDGAIHLDGAAYWFLFDVASRVLRVYDAPSRLLPSPPNLLHTATFDAAGSGQLQPPLDDEEHEAEASDD